MIRTCCKLVRFSIGVSRVDLTPRELRQNHKLDFFPIVGRRQQKLGACILNQPANQNILTEEFVDELYRFLLSYDFDHSVHNIWIESKDNVFSHGIDYKRLSEDRHYLDKLAKLAILVASGNKPVFAQVAGWAKGAGAHLLSMLTMPLAYRNSCFLKLDDAARGLTPLFGGSHRLSRLPMHLGLYLALTGDELNFEEMTQLGYIRGAICEGAMGSDIRTRLEEANLYFREKPRYSDGDEGQLQEEEKFAARKNENLFKEHLKYRQGEILSQASRNLNMKFAANQHLAANADYFNVLSPQNSFSQTPEVFVNNYYLQRLQRPLDYITRHGLVQPFQLDGLQIPRLDISRIDYIFAMDTIEEILEALRQEPAEWAQRAFRRISSADPLAIHLTFQLIKQAEQLPWIACLEKEFTVARRLLQRSTLRLKTYKSSSQYVLENEYTGKGLAAVPEEVVLALLKEGEGDYRLQHSVAANSLHPYSDYYQQLPDSVRKYLNQEQLNDSMLSEQLPEVMRYMNQNKINYSSQVFDVDRLRKAQFEKLEVEKQRQAQRSRLSILARNDRFLQRFTKERQAYLDAIQDQGLDALIQQQLATAFRSKFEQRFADFKGKTAGMIGLEKKLELFKGIKDTILNNLLYNGAAYEEYQKRNTSFEGPLYFDSQGRDLYSSANPNVAADPALKQLSQDLQKGLTLSDSFLQHENQEMPVYTVTPPLPLKSSEVRDREIWELIKFRYDQKPEVWAEAYIYKEMIEQAARTSEELSAYLDWSSENFYDLLNQSEKKKVTYGQFAADIVTELKTIRKEKKAKLDEVEKQRKSMGDKAIYSKIYQLRDEEKMRQCFPYLVNQSTIPGEFRRSFLAVLDSTLKEFTEMRQGQSGHRLLFKDELGVVDKWINKDIATSYTSLLKHDVEYVTSYLQILMVKDIIAVLREYREEGRTLHESLEAIRQHFNVDFHFSSPDIKFNEVHAKIFSFLYFLMDLHTAAKRHIRSPQSKLIDFINRLKQTHEQNPYSAMPYSFESLILMIAKDRRRIYNRFLGEQFVSEPEFYLEHITREAKKSGSDLLRRKDPNDEITKVTFGNYVNQHSDLYTVKKKTLIQNYFFYMMLFEKHVHEVCGKEAFLPDDFVPQATKALTAHCACLFRPKTLPHWLMDELQAIIEQLLAERLEAEQKLTKGELYLFDQRFHQRFSPQNIRLLIKKKLEEEVYLLRNMFVDERQYDAKLTEEEIADQVYTRTKRAIRNPEALKKLNNLAISEEIFVEYMEKTAGKPDDLSAAEAKFSKDQSYYYKNGMVTRLPSKSYHRMARDLFDYPEEIYPQKTPEDIKLFKKTHLTFDKSVAEKIVLTNFTEEYKSLNNEMKNTILEDMVTKIKAVESL